MKPSSTGMPSWESLNSEAPANSPKLVGGERDRDLDQGDEDGAGIPARRVRQLPPRPGPLQDEEEHRRKKHNNGRQDKTHPRIPKGILGIGRILTPIGSGQNDRLRSTHESTPASNGDGRRDGSGLAGLRACRR